MHLIFIISAGGIASLGKKKKLSKLGPVMEKKVVPVETDTQKLVNYVCGSNLLKEGEDVKLKPDDEYPDWLWTLRTGETLHECLQFEQEYFLPLHSVKF